MAKKYAQINPANLVTNIIGVSADQSDPVAWCQARCNTTDNFVEVNAASTHAAAVDTGWSYSNSMFTDVKPYASFVANVSENVTMWDAPVTPPLTINNDMPDPYDPPPNTIMALNLFQWDEDNVRWLNGLGQYWDAVNLTWVDI
tara:strand:+ start:75 stop:506 length:432 start_codon:yes stop_codon:yes gene_type:complete